MYQNREKIVKFKYQKSFKKYSNLNNTIVYQQNLLKEQRIIK